MIKFFRLIVSGLLLSWLSGNSECFAASKQDLQSAVIYIYAVSLDKLEGLRTIEEADYGDSYRKSFGIRMKYRNDAINPTNCVPISREDAWSEPFKMTNPLGEPENYQLISSRDYQFETYYRCNGTKAWVLSPEMSYFSMKSVHHDRKGELTWICYVGIAVIIICVCIIVAFCVGCLMTRPSSATTQ